MISVFNYHYYECYCTLCYMYLQVIRINIIIIIMTSSNFFLPNLPAKFTALPGKKSIWYCFGKIMEMVPEAGCG